MIVKCKLIYKKKEGRSAVEKIRIKKTFVIKVFFVNPSIFRKKEL